MATKIVKMLEELAKKHPHCFNIDVILGKCRERNDDWVNNATYMGDTTIGKFVDLKDMKNYISEEDLEQFQKSEWRGLPEVYKVAEELINPDPRLN